MYFRKLIQWTKMTWEQNVATSFVEHCILLTILVTSRNYNETTLHPTLAQWHVVKSIGWRVRRTVENTVVYEFCSNSPHWRGASLYEQHHIVFNMILRNAMDFLILATVSEWSGKGLLRSGGKILPAVSLAIIAVTANPQRDVSNGDPDAIKMILGCTSHFMVPPWWSQEADHTWWCCTCHPKHENQILLCPPSPQIFSWDQIWGKQVISQDTYCVHLRSSLV